MHRILPLSEYEHCSIEWQMPGGLKLVHFSDLETETIDSGSDLLAEKGMGLEEDEDGEPQQEMEIVAFAVVSLMDETGLMGLLDSQSTRLQFVEQGRRTGRLFPLENQFARISIFDLKKDRVYKLSESYFPQSAFSAGDLIGVYDFTATRRFSCFDREIQIFPSFEEEATSSEGKDGNRVVTVKLDVVTRCCDGEEDEDEDDDRELQEFTSVLELWKFLELCLTALEFVYAKLP